DAITVALGDGRRDVDGALQNIGHDATGARGVIDHRAPAAAGRLHCRLHRAVQRRDEDRRAKPVPEVTLDFARKAGAPELVRPWGVEWNDDTGRCASLGPQDKDTRNTLLNLSSCF